MTKTEEFIEKARKIHGDKYDYSKVEYVNSKTKVKIICPVHGEFEQTPNSHLMGHGCGKCKAEKHALNTSKTTETFVKEYVAKYGEKYSFEKSNYVNAQTKICVTCPIHGDFMIKPYHLMNGHGCPKCGIENGHRKQTKTVEEFIKEAKKVHGNKYDYSKVEYKSRSAKIKIICPEHGEFEISPLSHLKGHGCPKCSKKHKYNTIEWINKANDVHQNKYDYSQSKYVNYFTKVKILCPEHGEFWQYPADHLKGCGCPKCNASKLELEIMCELDSLGVNYIHLASKNILKWIGRQSLDFYLPDYKIGIECQGKQHFEPVDFAGKGEKWAKENFEYIRKLDERKKTLCEANNVNLLYFDGKNKEQLLEKILCLSKKR